MDFAERIRIARENSRLTQRELAEAMDVTRAQVAHWESGIRTPSVAEMRKLANILKVQLAELLGEWSADPIERELVQHFRYLPRRTREVIRELVLATATEYLETLDRSAKKPDLRTVIRPGEQDTAA